MCGMPKEARGSLRVEEPGIGAETWGFSLLKLEGTNRNLQTFILYKYHLEFSIPEVLFFFPLKSLRTQMNLALSLEHKGFLHGWLLHWA